MFRLTGEEGTSTSIDEVRDPSPVAWNMRMFHTMVGPLERRPSPVAWNMRRFHTMVGPLERRASPVAWNIGRFHAP
jgi:hypothetical protein